MKLKTARNFIVLAFLFIFTTNLSLEARHHHHRYTEVHVVNQQYITPVYSQPYVVQQYYQPVYAYPTAPVVVYEQAPVVYQERVYVRERSCPGKSLVTFALGLGIGLLAR